MIESHFERADNGRVLPIALAAIVLILAGLGMMAWDDGGKAHAPVPLLLNP